MRGTQTTARAATEKPHDASQSHRAARGFRVVAIVVLMSVGCYLAYGFGRLWAEWRQAERPAAARVAATANFNSMAAVLPLAGQWSFAELDWNLRSSIVEQSDVAPRFEKLAAAPVSGHEEHLPDVGKDLVDLAESFQIEPIERDGNQVYRLDRSGLKAQLTARNVGGSMKIVALAAAYPHTGTQWQMMEFTPRALSGKSVNRQPGPLPLPAGAERIGGRFADDGRPLLELISLDSTADELFATWKNSGWEVRSTGLGGPGGFSYLCARGDAVVYAWSADPRESLRNLMLVRTPNDSATGR